MSPVESIGTALHDAAHAYEPNVVAAVNGALERGRRGRRNRRIAQAAGSTAAVVAVGAASVFIGGGTAGKHHSAAASPSKPTPAASTASENVSKIPVMAGTDKVIDIRMHLPALLQQLLPSGTAIADAPKTWTAQGIAAVFVATSAKGVSQIEVQAGLPDRFHGMPDAQDFCYESIGGVVTKPCETRKVTGGTVYILPQDKTPSSESAGHLTPGVYQPGHENDVVWKGLQLTFVPDDHSKPYLQIQEMTQVAPEPYASSAPPGAKYFQWPPTDNDIKSAAGTDLAISADDFAAVAGKPQIGQIAHLLDNDVPASPSAIAERESINAQVAKLAGPVLPAGLKLTVNYSEPDTGLMVLTGPTSANGFQWFTASHGHGLLDTNNLTCGKDESSCVQKKVSGGTVQWKDEMRDPSRRMAWFEYVPDDPTGQEVVISFFADDPSAGFPTDASKAKAAAATAQLTFDQMVEIVTTPGIADIMSQTSLLAK